jgi:CubicO group peptidase (beta-lactamase class C family)
MAANPELPRRTRLRTRALVFLLASAILAAPMAAIAADPDFSAISRFIEEQRSAQQIPGLAVAIVGGDGTVYVAGFGTADASGRTVASNTPFILGSTSKSFTALAMMQLAEAGRVDLDAPVQRHLPWFRVADEAASATMTIRQLLNQTSGLPTSAGRRTLTDFSSGEDALRNRVRQLRSVALTAPVGTTYQYSNCNYQVLGAIIEAVSGQSYESYMAQHVFAPLAMQRTFTAKAPAVEAGLATGHRAWFGRPAAFDEPYPRASVPQGFIISTAQDLAHYLTALLNGGRYLDASVLSSAGIAELHRGAAREGDSDTYYAMGWNSGEIDGERAVWHEGDTFGYQSFMVLLTDARWGVAVLSNVNDIPATAQFEEFAFNIVRMLIGRPPQAQHSRDANLTYALLAAILVLQLLGMARTIALLRRWRRDPSTRPGGPRAALRALAPSLLNLLWAGVVLVWLPSALAPLQVLLLAAPDVGYLLVGSGVAALLWAAIRAALVYRVVRA